MTRSMGDTQVDMVVEKEPRVLYLDPQRAERESNSGLGLSI